MPPKYERPRSASGLGAAAASPARDTLRQSSSRSSSDSRPTSASSMGDDSLRTSSRGSSASRPTSTSSTGNETFSSLSSGSANSRPTSTSSAGDAIESPGIKFLLSVLSFMKSGVNARARAGASTITSDDRRRLENIITTDLPSTSPENTARSIIKALELSRLLNLTIHSEPIIALAAKSLKNYCDANYNLKNLPQISLILNSLCECGFSAQHVEAIKSPTGKILQMINDNLASAIGRTYNAPNAVNLSIQLISNLKNLGLLADGSFNDKLLTIFTNIQKAITAAPTIVERMENPLRGALAESMLYCEQALGIKLESVSSAMAIKRTIAKYTPDSPTTSSIQETIFRDVVRFLAEKKSDDAWGYQVNLDDRKCDCFTIGDYKIILEGAYGAVAGHKVRNVDILIVNTKTNEEFIIEVDGKNGHYDNIDGADLPNGRTLARNQMLSKTAKGFAAIGYDKFNDFDKKQGERHLQDIEFLREIKRLLDGMGSPALTATPIPSPMQRTPTTQVQFFGGDVDVASEASSPAVGALSSAASASASSPTSSQSDSASSVSPSPSKPSEKKKSAKKNDDADFAAMREFATKQYTLKPEDENFWRDIGLMSRGGSVEDLELILKNFSQNFKSGEENKFNQIFFWQHGEKHVNKILEKHGAEALLILMRYGFDKSLLTTFNDAKVEPNKKAALRKMFEVFGVESIKEGSKAGQKAAPVLSKLDQYIMDFSKESSGYRSKVIAAIQDGERSIVQFLLLQDAYIKDCKESELSIIKTQDDLRYNGSLLYQACIHDNADILRDILELITKSGKKETNTRNQNTLLGVLKRDNVLISMAVNVCTLDAIECLIDYGVNPESVIFVPKKPGSNFGYDVPLLSVSMMNNNPEVANFLIRRIGRKAEVLSNQDFHPTNIAAEYNFPDLLELMLDYGYGTECDGEGFSPLHVATIHNNEKCLDLLLNRKANFLETSFADNYNGKTVLDIAIDAGNHKLVDRILQSYESPGDALDDMKPPIFLRACRANQEEMANVLMSHEVDVDHHKEGEEPAISIVLNAKGCNFQPETIKRILKESALKNEACIWSGANQKYRAPLAWAILNFDAAKVQMMCEIEGISKERARGVSSFLLMACYTLYNSVNSPNPPSAEQYLDIKNIIETLLRHGANPNPEVQSLTPLGYLCRISATEVIKPLLDRGANCLLRNSYATPPQGRTAEGAMNTLEVACLAYKEAAEGWNSELKKEVFRLLVRSLTTSVDATNAFCARMDAAKASEDPLVFQQYFEEVRHIGQLIAAQAASARPEASRVGVARPEAAQAESAQAAEAVQPRAAIEAAGEAPTQAARPSPAAAAAESVALSSGQSLPNARR